MLGRFLASFLGALVAVVLALALATCAGEDDIEEDDAVCCEAPDYMRHVESPPPVRA